ncbi:NADH-quinone oxidoreductase subunit N [bacterium]|nr:NADH-quinone oxidoreductase subunit N [bacterium]
MLNDIFNILLPHIALGGFIIILFLMGMILPIRMFKYSRPTAIIGIYVTIALLSTVQMEPQYFGFKNSVMSDTYTLLFDFIILICGFLVAILNRTLIYSIKRNAYTFYAILLAAILGAMNVVSANDFLTLFVSMELLGFSTYYLIASAKGYPSKEASFKYLITSAVSTGVFLFGVSYLYGITGSINFSAIYEKVANEEFSLMYSVSSILIVLGLISKLAIFPFANWIIDVYKGCETSVLAFLSTIPKLALFGIIARLLVFPLGSSFELTFVIALFSLITAFWANTYAIKENNVKVILGCSASANASYVLLAASLVSVYNLSTVLFYLICYVFMNIGVFAFLNIYGDKKPMHTEDFKGFFAKNHGLTFSYAISILALAGIPVTSGFIAKIYLFSGIAKSGLIFVPFLITLMLLTVAALFYYLKILVPLFEECDKNTEIPTLKALFSQKFVLVTSAAIILVIGICPEKLIELCQFIAYNI